MSAVTSARGVSSRGFPSQSPPPSRLTLTLLALESKLGSPSWGFALLGSREPDLLVPEETEGLYSWVLDEWIAPMGYRGISGMVGPC